MDKEKIVREFLEALLGITILPGTTLDHPDFEHITEFAIPAMPAYRDSDFDVCEYATAEENTPKLQTVTWKLRTDNETAKQVFDTRKLLTDNLGSLFNASVTLAVGRNDGVATIKISMTIASDQYEAVIANHTQLSEAVGKYRKHLQQGKRL